MDFRKIEMTPMLKLDFDGKFNFNIGMSIFTPPPPIINNEHNKKWTMNNGKRSKDQILKDRSKIAELYLKGWTQLDIAKHLNQRFENPEGYSISQQSISNDLKTIRKIWEESALIDFNKRISLEVAKIDALQKMYHEAYARSLQPTIKKSQTGFKDNNKKQQGHKVKPITQEEEDKPDRITVYHSEYTVPEGNIAALNGALKCSELRCKLLGIIKNNIDLTSQGKALENKNIIILPENRIDEVQTFDEERIRKMISALEAEQKSD